MEEDLLDVLLRRRRKKARNAMRAMMMRAAATPMPALAPVERPDDDDL